MWKQPWPRLAAALLALACSGDATAPNPYQVDPEPQPPPANRAPVASGKMPAQRLRGPEEPTHVEVGVLGYFTDPDGDPLSFAAASSDTAVVVASVDGNIARLDAGGRGGEATVTVTATDPTGASVGQSFAVVVNRAPVVVGEMPELTLVAGAPALLLDVTYFASYFSDPEGDTLLFRVSSSDTSVVTAYCCRSSNGGPWVAEFLPIGLGDAQITVTARDAFPVEPGTLRHSGASVTTSFPIRSVGKNPETDRPALKAFFEATVGSNWWRSGNWLTDAPIEEWEGVQIRGDGRVVALNLSDNNLTGAVPLEQLEQLDALESLKLSDNDLIGSIPPEMGDLTSLRELWLSDNNLSGPLPPTLGRLRRLQSLRLSLNNLSGSIPPELGDLAILWELYLSDNNLSGSIPSQLGQLAWLQRLGLSDNNLSGPIPTELGNLTSLGELALYDNNLTGPIPPELGDLASLRSLALGGNNLTGPIPPELGQLASLRQLSLYDNNLIGPIPAALGDLASLWSLVLSGNNLTGVIPPEFADLDSLRQLSLSDNNLIGPIPAALGDFVSLESLLLGYNNLTGPIPPELGQLGKLRSPVAF